MTIPEGRYVSVEKAAKAMERIVSMKDQYDHVINSQHDIGALAHHWRIMWSIGAGMHEEKLWITAEIREILDPLAECNENGRCIR